MRIFLRYIALLACAILWSCTAFAQRSKISFKDSLDGKFDLSDYVINVHGFIPVPMIITERALGGFGFLLAPIFLKKRPPFVDSVGGKVKISPVPPDITGVAGGYTANKTWFAMGFRSGTWLKPKIKYMVGGMYGDINMSYYRQIGDSPEKELKFNIQTTGALLQATKRIGTSKWYIGLKYLFAHSNVGYRPDTSMPDFVKPIEISSNLSQLGALVEFDSRDNVFTPNNGVKIHVDGIRSADVLGSDYDFWRVNYYTYMYKTVFKKYTIGLRLDGQQNFGDAPFYLLPFLDMRGVPVNRYQGKADILAELELRLDIYKRWSLMLYSGSGKAFNDWSDWGETDLVTIYGTGFRYLLARKFGLRTGIDVAKGPENWTYYIVFGSNWLK